MRIKVFKAESMKEAMALVKDELGIDAVILHTKKYKKGGFLGYKSKEYVEVTAAVEDQPKRPRMPKLPDLSAAITAAPVVPKNVVAQYKTAGTEAAVTQAKQPEMQTAGLQEAVKPETDFKPMEPARMQPVTESAPVSRVVKPMEQGIPAFEPLKDEQQGKIERLEDELAKMKTMLVQVMNQEHVPEETVSLQEAMKLQEVDEAVRKDMILRMPAEAVIADKNSEEAQKALKSYIFQNMHIADGLELKADSRRAKVAALIGATGVGKTTTLAKIAARLVLEQGISAALITADTYRISAVEQLKTYSDIIGLPLEIVYSPEELKKAIRKYRDKQLILIDTAGRSQHNERQMQELKDFLAVDESIEKYLVMSATTKSRDAKEILEKFSVCNPDKIVFTKTDETSSLGIILNLLYQQKIAAAYLTNGQSVPDDIVSAKADKIAELLLR